MIDTIVFDFGQVLIDWNPRYYYNKVFNSNEEMEWFLLNVCNDEWNMEQDRGRTFRDGCEALKKVFPEHAVNIDLFFSEWRKMLKGEISGTVEILSELRKKYKIYGLTNWSAETFPYTFDRFDFLKYLDGIVVSGEEKLIKPDKEIFQLLLDRYNLVSQNCIFIDDNKHNITTAHAMGFNAIRFESPQQLREVLRTKGVL